MADNELVYSIGSVFGEAEFDEFRIPSYQRGYKWTKENIEKLLEDINNFEPKSDDSFYCIQNITICEHPTEDERREGMTEHYFDVVDGQQRLTTTFILLCFLNQQALVRGKLIYEIRQSTKDFLDKYIITRKCWEEGFRQKHKPQHMDEFYIMQAAQTIEEWFATNIAEDKREDFLQKVLHRTKMIVNKLDGKDEELTFTNLNGAKVPLDGADLVRAILITRSVRDAFVKVPNLSLNKQYRIRMGLELDSIALWWGNEDVRTFFGRFIPASFQQIAKGKKFDRSAYEIDTLYMLFYLSKRGNPKDFSIDWFENINYNEIREFHSAMTDWFENDRLYHYIGYLAANNPIPFFDIYDSWCESNTRADFENKIKSKIKKFILSLVTVNETENETEKDKSDKRQTALLDTLLSNITNTDFDWYHDPGLPKLLLLKDVITVLNAKKNIKRIPVDYQGVNNEDLEHVCCQTPNDETIANKDAWRSCIDGLKTSGVSDDELEKLRKMLEEPGEITQETKDEFIDVLTKSGLNSIGNLVLLDKSVNRGYGNDGYQKKKLAILSNFFNENQDDKWSHRTKDRHIRPQTLKIFIASNKDVWDKNDIEETAEQFGKTIDAFLSSIK